MKVRAFLFVVVFMSTVLPVRSAQAEESFRYVGPAPIFPACFFAPPAQGAGGACAKVTPGETLDIVVADDVSPTVGFWWMIDGDAYPRPAGSFCNHGTVEIPPGSERIAIAPDPAASHFCGDGFVTAGEILISRR